MSWFIFIALELLRNYAIIKWWKKSPLYDWNVMIRFGSGFAFLYWNNRDFDPVGDPFTIWPALAYGAFQFTSFYLLFDALLNLFRGKPWGHQGENSGSYFDKQEKRKYYRLKLTCLILLPISIYTWNLLT